MDGADAHRGDKAASEGRCQALKHQDAYAGLRCLNNIEQRRIVCIHEYLMKTA